MDDFERLRKRCKETKPKYPMSKELTGGTPLSRFKQKIKRLPGALRILTEGDSWFAFPLPSRPNIPDNLITTFGEKAAWLRLEGNGDEAVEMLKGEQRNRLRALLADNSLGIEALLFSGGGNDIVGDDLLPLLKDFVPGADWRSCIDQERFLRRMDQIEAAYEELVDLRDDHRPSCVIFTHAYDLAIPSGKAIRLPGVKAGPWMQPYLAQRKIEDAVMQRQIIRYMLEQFGELMSKLEKRHQGVVYVRTQGTLADTQWGDELHPTAAGFAKLAGLFASALRARFPDRL